jgi:hypothetical protein
MAHYISVPVNESGILFDPRTNGRRWHCTAREIRTGRFSTIGRNEADFPAGSRGRFVPRDGRLHRRRRFGAGVVLTARR